MLQVSRLYLRKQNKNVSASKNEKHVKTKYVTENKCNVTFHTQMDYCARNAKKSRALSHYRIVYCIRSTGLGWADAAVVKPSKDAVAVRDMFNEYNVTG